MLGETQEKGVRYLTQEKSNYGKLEKTALYTLNDKGIPIFKTYTDKKDRDYVMAESRERNIAPALEDLVLKKDRSFTFAIDKMDKDETQGVLAGASALARQQREVIIPEVDSYTYGVMAANAGTKVVDVTLTAENIYDEIIEGTKALDDNDVPDTGRILTVVPDVYRMMKKNTELNIDCDITAEQRAKGVIAMVDGMDVIKMTAKKMPERAGFMISHPVATVAPTKLEDYKIHQDPPGISGELVEGRIVYDAFVLDNKKMAIYYVENKATE